MVSSLGLVPPLSEWKGWHNLQIFELILKRNTSSLTDNERRYIANTSTLLLRLPINTKLHGARELSKHYHMQFDTRLGHGIYTIHCIPCACAECIYMLYKPCIHGLTTQQYPPYQSVTDQNYWLVISSFNNWNIIKFQHKSTTGEDFKDIHKVVLDGISENTASLFQSSKYGAMNTTYLPKMG